MCPKNEKGFCIISLLYGLLVQAWLKPEYRKIIHKDDFKSRLLITWFDVCPGQKLPTLVVALYPDDLYIDDMYFSWEGRIYILTTYLHTLLLLVGYQSKDLAWKK